jgi:hypothetical protein
MYQIEKLLLFCDVKMVCISNVFLIKNPNPASNPGNGAESGSKIKAKVGSKKKKKKKKKN